MIDHGRKNVLGVLVSAVDYDAATQSILAAAREGRSFSATALAVHGVITGFLDKAQRHRLNHLDLVTPDGQPVRWVLNWAHATGLADRVYGPALMLRLCEAAARDGLPVFLYGSHKSVVDALAHRLAQRFPGLTIAGAEPSRFRSLDPEERSALATRIRNSAARLVFVGLGCPRQEVFVYELRDLLPLPMIGVGAAFDYHAGFAQEPPAWMQRTGLQWLYRLAQDPRRLWRRYLLLNSLFAAGALLQLCGLLQVDALDTRCPKGDLRYG
jgi:N-acetylglucosaminyldiphosphoundecaprenol N-acetyl-beta-D-mannosaminyltransferase